MRRAIRSGSQRTFLAEEKIFLEQDASVPPAPEEFSDDLRSLVLWSQGFSSAL